MVLDDENDLAELLTALFDGLSLYTKWNGWTIDSHEAHSIARPASRILARHAWLGEAVAKVADPVALVVASAAIVGPRIVGYKLALAEYQRLAAQRAQAPTPPPGAPPEPPTKAAPNGETRVNFADRLLRENGI